MAKDKNTWILILVIVGILFVFGMYFQKQNPIFRLFSNEPPISEGCSQSTYNCGTFNGMYCGNCPYGEACAVEYHYPYGAMPIMVGSHCSSENVITDDDDYNDYDNDDSGYDTSDSECYDDYGNYLCGDNEGYDNEYNRGNQANQCIPLLQDYNGDTCETNMGIVYIIAGFIGLIIIISVIKKKK